MGSYQQTKLFLRIVLPICHDLYNNPSNFKQKINVDFPNCLNEEPYLKKTNSNDFLSMGLDFYIG